MADKTDHTSVPELEQPSAALLISAADSGDEGEVTAPDLTPPDAPTNLIVTYDGWVVEGFGEPGTTVRVYGEDGTIIGTDAVSSDGSFQATLEVNQTRGEVLTVTLTDASGNESAPGSVTAPTTSLRPRAPDVDGFNKEGTKLTGKGEVGCTVTALDEEGNVLWTTVVLEDGTFSFDVDPPMVRGELVEVYQTNSDSRSASVFTRAFINVPEPTDCSECEAELDKLKEEVELLKKQLENKGNVNIKVVAVNGTCGAHGFVNGIFRGPSSIYRSIGNLV